MSISGLHVTMFAWLAALVTGWLWRQSGRLCLALPAPTAGLAGGLLLAAAYAVFSGWGVPSQRTIWMLATVGLLRFLGKRWPWPLVWMLACAVVVAIDPWALLQAGFWLSFVAVGLLFATENGALNKGSTGADGSFYIKNWQKFVSILREQWIITLGLAPLTLILFGQASVVGLLANAVAIPWVTLVVTPLAMLGAALALVWPALLALAVSAIDALSWSLQHFAALPFAVVAIPQPPWWAAASAIAGGLLLVVPWPLGLRALGLPLLCPFLLWQPLGVPDGEFELLAADIGQGNAVILRTASHALLYDAGPRFSLESDAGSRVLVPLLRAIGVTLDTVVLSHRDTDHVGGAAAVLAMQPQAALISSLEAGHEIEQLRPVQRCLAGQHWVWDGVAFEVLHPAAGDYSQAGERLPRPNTLSCVLRVVSRSGRAALLTGDVEAAQEKRLAQAAALGLIRLESDVLLVPHHGSKTSSSPEFLDAVKPHIALVQAGYRNRFGHPVALVMDRYLERHIQVQISARCGAESWRSDQPELTTCQRVLGARYWHHQGF